MKVLVTETLHEERCEQVHTLIIKAAPAELVMVDGVECYIGRDGHPYVASGPAKGVLPNSFPRIKTIATVRILTVWRNKMFKWISEWWATFQVWRETDAETLGLPNRQGSQSRRLH